MTVVIILLVATVIAFGFNFIIKINIQRKRLWMAIFSFLLITGSFLAVTFFSVFDISLKLKQWPTAEAKIISSEVAGKRAFHPEVVLEYSVNNQHYTLKTDMDVPGFGTKNNRLNVARETVIENFPGKMLTVHYNPDNPAEAVLHTSGKFSSYVFLSIGVFMYAFGVYGVLSFLFNLTKPQPLKNF